LEDRLAALMSRISGGDQAALAELYDTTSRLAFGLICRVLQDRAAAEEVLLDVYTRAWTQAGDYASDRISPFAWLMELSRTRAIHRLRSGNNAVLQPAAAHEATDADSAVSPEQRRLVCAALQDLAPEQRQVLELAFFSGLNHREIAACLDRPLETVKTQLREAILDLRPLLAVFQEAAASPHTSRSAAP
jgi:RNA polymerase sigma-70 factor (ECF subfamily)